MIFREGDVADALYAFAMEKLTSLVMKAVVLAAASAKVIEKSASVHDVRRYVSQNLLLSTIRDGSSIGESSILDRQAHIKSRRFHIQYKPVVEECTAVTRTTVQILRLSEHFFRKLNDDILYEMNVWFTSAREFRSQRKKSVQTQLRKQTRTQRMQKLRKAQSEAQSRSTQRMVQEVESLATGLSTKRGPRHRASKSGTTMLSSVTYFPAVDMRLKLGSGSSSSSMLRSSKSAPTVFPCHAICQDSSEEGPGCTCPVFYHGLCFSYPFDLLSHSRHQRLDTRHKESR